MPEGMPTGSTDLYEQACLYVHNDIVYIYIFSHHCDLSSFLWGVSYCVESTRI